MSRGFTLLEFLVATVTVALVAELGTPNFLSAIKDNHSPTAANDHLLLWFTAAVLLLLLVLALLTVSNYSTSIQ